jgi:uncharacterized membrane protein
MGKNRPEAFSDGVIAIMVLELKVPTIPISVRCHHCGRYS